MIFFESDFIMLCSIAKHKPSYSHLCIDRNTNIDFTKESSGMKENSKQHVKDIGEYEDLYLKSKIFSRG